VLCFAVLCCVVGPFDAVIVMQNTTCTNRPQIMYSTTACALLSVGRSDRRLTDMKSRQKKLSTVSVSVLVECEMRTEHDRKHRLLTNCLSTHISVCAPTPVRTCSLHLQGAPGQP
jgi:hypothetical protein